MHLYTFDFAPNPRRLMYFLRYKGISIPTTEISLREKQNFTPEYRAITPYATVPALVTGEGVTLTDVIGICSYLEDIHPEPRLLGSSRLSRAEVLGWDHKIFIEGLVAVAEMLRNQGDFFKDRALPGLINLPQIPALIERGRQRLHGFWPVLEARLEGRDFLVGAEFSLADIDAYVLVYFAGWMKEAIPEDCTLLRTWHARVAALLGESPLAA